MKAVALVLKQANPTGLAPVEIPFLHYLLLLIQLLLLLLIQLLLIQPNRRSE